MQLLLTCESNLRVDNLTEEQLAEYDSLRLQINLLQAQLAALGCSVPVFMTSADYALMKENHAKLLDQVIAGAAAAGIVPTRKE